MAFGIVVVDRRRGAYVLDIMCREIVLQGAAQHVLLVPVIGLQVTLDMRVFGKIGKTRLVYLLVKNVDRTILITLSRTFETI